MRRCIETALNQGRALPHADVEVQEVEQRLEGELEKGFPAAFNLHTAGHADLQHIIGI